MKRKPVRCSRTRSTAGCLQAQTGVWLKVKDHAGWFGPKFPENADMLVFENIDLKPITDTTRLRSLFELMEATLGQLCRMGSATNADPGFIL